MNQTQIALGSLATLGLGGLLLGTAAIAELAPTARYARGEAVDQALIIREWKSRMPQIPVYACTCQAESCDAQASWPFRRYNRYQSLVALGPFNAAYNNSLGFQCFDIATGAAPDKNLDPAQTTAQIVSNRSALEITHRGQTRRIHTDNWKINLVDALDCDNLTQVSQKQFGVLRLTDALAIDPVTGQVAVGVLLSECVEVQQSAVFVVNPAGNANGGGAWSVYRLMVPGPLPLPNGASSYPLNSISGLAYIDGNLLVGQNTVADNAALLVFKTGPKTAGTYGTCIELSPGENPDGLCPLRE